MKRCLPLAWFLTILFLIIISQDSLAASASTEGGRWLGWNDETRFEYVQAYVDGYERGFYEACAAALNSNLHSAQARELSLDKCRRRVPRHSKDLGEYVELITQYYRSYPDDLNVAISELLEAFSDPQHLTIEQTHGYYAPSAKKIPKN